MKYAHELYHHGIPGQKWGVRRFQNPDGTRTKLGKKRTKLGKKRTKLGKERNRRKSIRSFLESTNNNGQFLIAEINRRMDEFNRWQIQQNQQAIEFNQQGLSIVQEISMNQALMMQNHMIGMF